MKAINSYFIPKVNQAIGDHLDFEEITEIRFRVDKPLILHTRQGEKVYSDCIMRENEIREIFNRITEYSAYAYEYSIQRGYLTLEGGHRVGLGGEIVYEGKQIKGMKHIRYLNFRVSHFVHGCSKKMLHQIQRQNTIWNTLIISPPGFGKTTLLRDFIRQFSAILTGTSICVIDERNEISGSYQGVPSIDLGIRTDVICLCDKEEGIHMAIRSLAPKIIAVDEIGTKQDLDALAYAVKSGVAVLATIHGENVEDAKLKLGHAYELLFQKYIMIQKKGEYLCF